MAENLLFTPLQVGPCLLPNRIVSAPHGTGQAVDNLVTKGHEAYYSVKARGGAGLIITENLRVHPTGLPYGGAIALFDERNIDGLARLAACVKQHGAFIVAQINHDGRAMKGGHTGLPLWAPSAIRSPLHDDVPKEMDPADIAELRRAFRDGAKRIYETGFDGVEIHGAHGYVIHQFLSPWCNKRNDAYGGSMANRHRLLLEILQDVREITPSHCMLGVRLSAQEGMAEGLQVEEMLALAETIADRRLVDYIHVSTSTYHPDSYWTMMPDMHEPMAPFTGQIRRFRQAMSGRNMPIMGVGRIHDPEMAEDLVRDGTLDLVAMARQLIADPFWPKKLREGRAHEIRPCIACNQGCVGLLSLGKPTGCVVNATAGRESEWDPERYERRAGQNTVILGGGLAGLEAARVAAEMGDRVTLFEAQPHLGGQARIASLAPHRGDFGRIINYFATEIKRLGVRVESGVMAGPDEIRSLAPDRLILALGAKQTVPDVLLGVPCHGFADALTGAVETPSSWAGRHVVLLDRIGHYQCYSTADALAAAGARVTLLSEADSLGAGLPLINLHQMLRRLERAGVECFTSSHIEAKGDDLQIRNTQTDAITRLDNVDRIVVAERPVPVRPEWIARLAPIPAVLVGDCKEAATALEAIHEAHRAARSSATAHAGLFRP